MMQTTVADAVLFLPFLLGALLFICLKPSRPTFFAKRLLTPNEAEFYERLVRALPQHHVLAQVSFGALLDTRSGWEVRRRFAMKIADFVICRPGSLQVVALVELDDRMHDRRKDARRDALTKAAGYITIRYDSRAKPSIEAIARHISTIA